MQLTPSVKELWVLTPFHTRSKAQGGDQKRSKGGGFSPATVSARFGRDTDSGLVIEPDRVVLPEALLQLPTHPGIRVHNHSDDME